MPPWHVSPGTLRYLQMHKENLQEYFECFYSSLFKTILILLLRLVANSFMRKCGFWCSDQDCFLFTFLIQPVIANDITRKLSSTINPWLLTDQNTQHN